MSDYQVPTLAELHQSPEIAYKNDALSAILHLPPHKDWVKARDDIKVKDDSGNKVSLQYIPIDKIEYLLTRLFQRWKVEVIDYKVLFHSVGVHVRLHYMNPITGEWLYQDGLGAVVMQNDKDAAASDMSKIKGNAVMLGLPSAESYAVKDAAEKIGPIFGKDLNRRDVIHGFKGSYTYPTTEQNDTRSPETPKPPPNSQNEEFPL